MVLRGTGHVLVGGVDIGSARYEIRVSKRKATVHGVKTVSGRRVQFPVLPNASGRIEADPDIIKQIFFGANKAVLELKDSGESITFFVKNWDGFSGKADIICSP